MSLAPRITDDRAFALAVASIGATGLAFAASGYGSASLMCLICLAGLLAGRLAGIDGRALLAVALGLVLILWIGWVHPPGGSRLTSAFTHLCGGALIGGALAVTLRARLRRPGWALAALGALLALTLIWELAEYLADQVFDTALATSRTDSALDVLFGCLGGAGAVGLAALMMRRSEGGPAPIA